MNLYKISQDVNNNWDTYDSAVVVAENEDEARKIIPDQIGVPDKWDIRFINRQWTKPENVKVEFLGKVDGDYLNNLGSETTVVSSFNAG